VARGRPPTVLALIDLTRLLYFGPAVFSVFLFGAIVAMPQGPDWSVLLRMVFLGVVGFSGGFVLNDWADRKTDRVALRAGLHDPDYARQLRTERRFTGTRPVSAGIVSPNTALAFALALIGISAAVALTFPSPHRFYVLGAIAFNTAAEPIYCAMKRMQRGFPIATFFHATLLGMCPLAAYLAVRRPDLTAALLFMSLYSWEVAFNQIYDTVDAENDRLRGISTLSARLGSRPVAAWCLALSFVTSSFFVFLWWSCGSGVAMLAAICTAALFLTGIDAFFLLRPQLHVARAAIRIHQLYLMLIVAGTVADKVLHWISLS